MTPLVRLYITQVAIGFGLGALMVAMLLWFNIANLGHLVGTSEHGIVAVVMLWVFFGALFGGVQFAIAIMGMADRDDDDDDHRGDLIPIRIRNRR